MNISLHAATMMFALAIPILGFAQQINNTESDIVIGDTLSSKNLVRAIDGPNTGKITKGSNVFHNQEIKTGENASAEFEFNDTTRFAIGEKSKITLDSFVYDPNTPDAGEMVVTATVGSFRFVSGLVKKENVTIKTPTSTIGIRGTAFDFHINEDGETVLALLDGEVTVCNQNRKCKTTRTVGHLIKVAIGGIITNPVKWSADLVQGVPFVKAFPFITNQKPLNNALKIPTVTIGIFANAITGPQKGPGKIIKKTTKTIKKTTKKITKGTTKVLKRIFKNPKLRSRKRKKRRFKLFP